MTKKKRTVKKITSTTKLLYKLKGKTNQKLPQLSFLLAKIYYVNSKKLNSNPCFLFVVLSLSVLRQRIINFDIYDRSM